MRSTVIGTCRCVVIAIVISVAGCGGVSPSRDVAQVKGVGISRGTLNHWVRVEISAGRDGPSWTGGALRSKVLSLLIAANWTLGEARELGLTLSPAEVEAQLELQQFDRLEGIAYEKPPRDTRLRTLLLSPKVSRRDKLWLLKVGLLSLRLEHRRLAKGESEVSQEQIQRYFREHQPRFHLAERRDLEIIETFKRHPIYQAKQEIEAGRSFADVARRLSNAPVAPGDLMLHYPRSKQSSPQLGSAIFEARPHVLVGPYKVALYYLFEVLKIYPAHEATLDQAEATIRRLLGEYRVATKLLGEFDARWRAVTRCKVIPAVAGCG